MSPYPLAGFLICALQFLAPHAEARVPAPSECAAYAKAQDSLACYTAIIKSFSGDTPPAHKAQMYHYRAILYYHGGMSEKALEDYTKAIALTPAARGAVRLRCERAGAYKKLSRYREALEDYRACSAGGNAWAEAEIGEALLGLGEAAQAVNSFTRAIGAGQNYGYIYRSRAKAYLLLGQDLKAAADADKAVAGDAWDLDALFLRARARLNSGDPRGALADLALLEERAGFNNEYYSYRGLARYLLGEKAAAEENFGKALEAQGYSDAASLNLACYWWGLKNDAEKARAVLSKHAPAKGAPPIPAGLAGCLKGLSR